MARWLPERGRGLRALGPALVPLATTAALAAVLLCDFLFGNKVLLFLDIGSDTYYSYYAYYYLLAQYVADLRLPFWSFQLGAGTSIVSLFQFLYDPFSLAYFAAGPRRIASLVAWTFWLKAVVAAGCAYAYVRYMRGSAQVAAVAALLWAFNGFLMLWGQHFFFGSWVVFLPLFFLGAERCWREGRWLLLALTAAFLALNLAIFFQAAVFLGLYLLARAAWDLQSMGARACAGRVAACVAAVVLGMGLSAVLWLPEYYVLSSSPRISGDPLQRVLALFRGLLATNEPAYYRSLASRVFSNNLEGVGSAYKGFLNYYESLQLYAGLLPLLVLPQAWAVLAPRERWLVLAGVVLVLGMVVTPAFALLMNGLQYASYRWGYGVIFVQVALAAFLLQRMLWARRVHLPLLAATVVVLGAAWAWLAGVLGLPPALLWTLPGLLAAQAVLLTSWVRARRRWIPFLGMMGVLCAALWVEHRPTFAQRSVAHKQFDVNGTSHYFDDGLRAVQQLRARDRGFFRLEKNHWILSLNDSAVQGYFGLDTYNSLNAPAYMDALRLFAIPGQLTAVRWNSLAHPYLADVLAVKYHLTRDRAQLPAGTVLWDWQGGVEIYERRTALPFGFTYDAYVPAVLLADMPAAERERTLLQAAIVEDAARGGLRPLERLAPASGDEAARQARRAEVLELQSMDEDRLRGRIVVAQDRLLFLAMPYDRGWSATVNGQPVALVRVNHGFMGIHLRAGESLVELRYVPPFMRAGGAASLASLGVAGLLWYRRRKAGCVDGC